MLFTNPAASRRPYDPALQRVMNLATARESRQWLVGWRQLHSGSTPLHALPHLARRLGLGQLHLKDESARSPLASFKVLGAPVALLRLVLRQWPGAGWAPADLLAGRHADALAGFTAISATDGNHGRALAAAAQSMGCRCVIVLHAHVSAEREQPIRDLGAEIVRITGNYDDSVQEAERLARAHGWWVVSDTSYDGYEDIPRDVMQGYGILVDELLEQVPARPDGASPFTHVLLQGGVGGLAAGVVAPLWERHGEQRPRFIAVEPEQADCLLQSAIAGRASRATGSVDSVMAGLACGETSPLAWRFLQPAVDLFMTVSDAAAEEAMRTLASGAAGDVPVLSGESGAAGLAGLAALMADPARAAQAGLGPEARVLLVSTEGATAPGVYQAITGRSPASVLQAQSAWMARPLHT